jgi:Spy/CpxP family protein refolding chaperone
MSTTTKPNPFVKLAAVAAMAIGLGAGSYGIAAAATGTTTTTTTAAPAAAVAAAPSADQGHGGWGGQRSDETLLTGDTLTKVQAAAVAEVGSGATVVRAETDADGNALYEVHMTKSDGTAVTAYVDKDFKIVSVETR